VREGWSEGPYPMGEGEREDPRVLIGPMS